MSELKNGDVVCVSNVSLEHATKDGNVGTYIGKLNRRSVVSNGTGILTWQYVIKKPEPKIIPWTIDTAPLPPFCIKLKNKPGFSTVVSVFENGVTLRNEEIIYWSYLCGEFDYVITREDIRPCGIE